MNNRRTEFKKLVIQFNLFHFSANQHYLFEVKNE